METIFSLEQKLIDNPELVTDAQNLTLDESKPNFGLKGEYGLYGSEKWLESLNTGKMEIRTYSGKISSIKSSGMHNEGKSFTILLNDGGSYSYSCVANEKAHLKLYKVGSKLKVTTYFEKLKNGRKAEFVKLIESDAA